MTKIIQCYNNLYTDGGITIQNFLKEDLIDEMVIIAVLTLLGTGVPLFGELKSSLNFRSIKSKQLIGIVVKAIL